MSRIAVWYDHFDRIISPAEFPQLFQPLTLGKAHAVQDWTDLAVIVVLHNLALALWSSCRLATALTVTVLNTKPSR